MTPECLGCGYEKTGGDWLFGCSRINRFPIWARRMAQGEALESFDPRETDVFPAL
jgi:hypothetical protein